MPSFEIFQSSITSEFKLRITLFITESEDIMGPKLIAVHRELLQVVVLQPRDGIIKIGLRAEDFVELKVQFNFYIKNLFGEIYRSGLLETTLSKSQTDVFSDEIIKPRPSGYTENIYFMSSYVIDCCIKVDHSFSENVMKQSILARENISQLQSNFRNLLDDKQTSDVTLTVGKDIVHSHKSILSARSPVFRKMFEHDMREATQNDVNLVDIDKSALEAFLLFLYTGIVDWEELNTVMALYSAADKYDVKSLQNTCSSIIESKITTETAVSVLRLADLHHDVCLKTVAADFISNNFEEVEATGEWKHLLESDAHLASFALKIVSSKFSTKRKRED